MVNALFSSKVRGTKDFELDGIHFGWKEIQVHILSIYMYSCSYSLSKKHCSLTENVRKRMHQNG